MRAASTEINFSQGDGKPDQRGIAGPRKSHSALLDPTLPLLAQSWQQNRLELGDHGNFAPREGELAADSIALNLVHAENPAITQTGAARLTLAYSVPSLNQARAALIACAARDGAPIAADRQSLALLTLAERIAASSIPVLIEGPTGTGKEGPRRFPSTMTQVPSPA